MMLAHGARGARIETAAFRDFSDWKNPKPRLRPSCEESIAYVDGLIDSTDARDDRYTHNAIAWHADDANVTYSAMAEALCRDLAGGVPPSMGFGSALDPATIEAIVVVHSAPDFSLSVSVANHLNSSLGANAKLCFGLSSSSPALFGESLAFLLPMVVARTLARVLVVVVHQDILLLQPKGAPLGSPRRAAAAFVFSSPDPSQAGVSVLAAESRLTPHCDLQAFQERSGCDPSSLACIEGDFSLWGPCGIAKELISLLRVPGSTAVITRERGMTEHEQVLLFRRDVALERHAELAACI
jgi:hypothetical protein